jgi:uncharacterized membrane protein YdjX (TVP38/TMEM64 family)
MTLLDRLRRHWVKITPLLAAAALASWFAYAHREGLNRETLIVYGRGLPVGWFLAAFLVFPLTGFPVSIFLFLAGIRFGLGGGMAVSAGAVAFHHVAAFYLAHGSFRDPVRHRLERAGYGIPAIRPGRRAWYTMLFAAIHGPPYAAKLYLLALTDVPFHIYFWAGAPVYVLFCLLPVGAGTALRTFDPTGLYLLAALAAALLAAGFWLRKRPGGASPAAPRPN